MTTEEIFQMAIRQNAIYVRANQCRKRSAEGIACEKQAGHEGGHENFDVNYRWEDGQ